MAVGTAAENALRNELYETFMAVARSKKATGDDVSVAMITLVAVHAGHNFPTETQQDAYLNWFVAGVEALLKGAGARTTARPNPLAPTGLQN